MTSKNRIEQEEVQNIQTITKFTKEQILASIKYQGKKDILDALLKDGVSYTIETIDDLVDKFMERKVN